MAEQSPRSEFPGQIRGTAPDGRTDRNLHITRNGDQIRISIFTATPGQSGYDIDIDPDALAARLRQLRLFDDASI